MKLIFPSGTEVQIKDKVSFKITNPMFYDTGSYSYTFKIVADFLTNKEFKFFNQYAGCRQFVGVSGVILEAGILNYIGCVYVKNAQNGYYECFYIPNDNITRIKDKYVDELTDTYELWSESDTEAQKNAKLQHTLTNPEDHDFSLFPTYTYDKEKTFPNFMYADYNLNLKVFQTNAIDFSYSWGWNSDSWALLVPFFNLTKVFNKALSSAGIAINQNALNGDADFKQLYLINNCAADKISIDNLHYNAVGNVMSVTNNVISYYVDFLGYTDLDNINDEDPIVFLVDIRENSPLGDYANKYYKAKFATENNVKTVTLDGLNIGDLTWADIENPDYPGYPYLYLRPCKIVKTHQNIVEISKHLPHLTIADFIQKFEKYLFIKVFHSFNGNSCQILKLVDILNSEDVEDVTEFYQKNSGKGIEQQVSGFSVGCTFDGNDKFTDEVKDFPAFYQLLDAVNNKTDLPTEGNNINDIRLVRNENFYYIYTEQLFLYDKYSKNGGRWVIFSYNFKDFKAYNGENEYTSDVSPLLWNINDYQNSALKYPKAILNKGFACYNFSDNIDKETLRVAFYRGIRTIENTDYPLVTYGVNDHAGKIAEANLSLDYESENSITKKLAVDWLTWNHQYRRDDTVDIKWPAKKLNNPEMWRKRAINGHVFFVKSIIYDINPDDSISVGDTEIALL